MNNPTTDGFDEAELRVALDMSINRDDGDGNILAESSVSPSSESDANIQSPEINIESRSFGNMKAFCNIMFNDAITTTDDKERWIYECITTASTGADTPKSNITPDHSQSYLDVFTGCHSQKQPEMDDSKSSALPDSMHKLWGLIQKHGGPCGVLAAIQAEMIRVLLFGRNNSGDEKYRLYYPFDANHSHQGTIDPITKDQVKEAMAMAIGMILARASIMPASLTSEREQAKHDTFSVHLVFPNKQINLDEKSSEVRSYLDNTWISEILQTTGKAETGDVKEPKTIGLNILTITCSIVDEVSLREECKLCSDEEDSSPESKRRKKKGVYFPTNKVKNQHANTLVNEEKLQQYQMSLLARGVADYLLGTKPVMMDSTNKVTSLSSIPLDNFCGPGGIIFFVMSIVESRGIDTIKNDMDDPNTTITSQFGHSSQELINLLLTGQAVSNVFDNSMTLSGELTCSGIQRRPAIGYLSQLESLHYCEVGGYYKSPMFPIWVIGSTSHFSVLFGDTACLQESQSDLLLERCRRAFKNAEEGGESGFISVDKLVLVVNELNLRDKIGDHGVQALKAFLEVSGAGIILWEEAWKALSRLLTGSSLESVLNTDGPMNNNTSESQIATHTSNIATYPEKYTNSFETSSKAIVATSLVDLAQNPPPPTAASSILQSDEELAKKLAEEWGCTQDSQMYNCTANSDETFARALQAQWDAEMTDTIETLPSLEDAKTDDDDGTNENVAATQGDENPLFGEGGPANPFPRTATPLNSNIKVSMTGSDARHISSDFEQYGCSFPLYHYNGLRGGTLTPFRVTRLNASEAVGSSIGLFSGASGHGSDDLESVVRTKWPSCTFDWLGRSAPFID